MSALFGLVGHTRDTPGGCSSSSKQADADNVTVTFGSLGPCEALACDRTCWLHDAAQL
jgi:hypothetical protein